MSGNFIGAADCEGNPYVSGQGLKDVATCFSYYGGTLDSGSRCGTREEAERAARLCNTAYAAGYERAMADLRELIGASHG